MEAAGADKAEDAKFSPTRNRGSSKRMFLGIEIGGTKLQLGVGAGDGGPLRALERFEIRPELGALGILEQIEPAAQLLIHRHQVRAIGIGFGGPVDAAGGHTIKSHQVEGWDDFSLGDWCRRRLGLPARIINDCDAACLAEARFGAGRHERVVLYVTVGSGIGGGLVIDGNLHHGAGSAVAEIGHLRPGLNAVEPDQTVESLASGWGIAAAAQARLIEPAGRQFLLFNRAGDAQRPEQVRQRLIEAEEAAEEYAADLLERCDGQVEQLTTKIVAQAASEGNELARDVLLRAAQALGWAIAQAITLLAPGVAVVGGGVALAEESLLLDPLRREIDRYVFPPLRGVCRVARSELGELVVVHGALAVAAKGDD